MSDLVPVSENVEGPTVLGDARERWLAARRELVTASDAAAILGFDPWRGQLAVYAEKVGALPPADEEHLAWGRDVEVAIGKAYARRAQRPVRALPPYELVRHPDAPWLGATRDAETEGSVVNLAPIGCSGVAPLECKAVVAMKAAQWEDEPPLGYQVQLGVQMACTGATWGSLVALIGGLQVVWKDIVRNDRFLAVALPRLEEFHLRVQRREPPEEVDALPTTSRALRALYGAEDGETVPLGHDVLALADQLEAAKARVSVFTDEAEEIENKLRRRMGTASFGALADGSFLTLKTTKVKGYTRVVAPSSYRALRRFRPRLRRRA